MNAAQLQDCLHRAAGRSAAIAGETCDLFRPTDPMHPLSPTNRILRLHAVFLPIGGGLRRPVQQNQLVWEGLFDAAYTRPGDILRRARDGAVFYIAAQQPLLPVLCVHALRIITITRPSTANVAGLNLYGGAIAATQTTIAEGWPSAITSLATQGTGQAGLAAELATGTWQIQLPTSLKLQLRTTDRISDDQGRIGIIASAETSDLGTTLIVRQAST
jgi:hypothetical protein